MKNIRETRSDAGAAAAGNDDGMFLKRAIDLRELIEGEAAKAENAEIMSSIVAEAMREQGLFWLLVPRTLGGHDTALIPFIEMVEELASSDTSTAWSMMANSVATTVAANYCTDDHVARMFGGPRLPVMAASYAPTGKAVRHGDHYVGSGRYGFGSGISHADWISAALVVHEGGAPVMERAGGLYELRPRVVGAFLPRDRVNILGNWNVVGLNATGSFDYEFPEQEIPVDWTFNQYWTEPQRASRSATLGTLAVVCAGHTAVLLGTARRSLHEAARLASQRKRLFSSDCIATTPTFKYDFVRNEAQFRAARALTMEFFREADAAAESGEALTDRQLQRMRQITTWVHGVCKDVVNFAFGSVSSSIRTPSVLGRNMVDAAVGTQHIIVSQMSLFDTAPTVIESWAEGRALPG